MVNSRDIDLLRPDVSQNCRIWLERCKAAGMKVLVTSTVRDEAYQTYLYEQGRSRPGGIVTNSRVPTYHAPHAGLAFDFCQNIRGKEYSDRSFFEKAAALAMEMGFSWGGNWKSFPDLPHLQWDSYGTWSNQQILRREYPPKMPLFEEETEMTQEVFDKMMDAYLEKRRQEAPNAWSEKARAWAEAEGLIRGNDGKFAYSMYTTREELATILYRMYQKIETNYKKNK